MTTSWLCLNEISLPVSKQSPHVCYRLQKDSLCMSRSHPAQPNFLNLDMRCTTELECLLRTIPKESFLGLTDIQARVASTHDHNLTLAATIRWFCPEDTNDHLRYRAHVHNEINDVFRTLNFKLISSTLSYYSSDRETAAYWQMSSRLRHPLIRTSWLPTMECITFMVYKVGKRL